VKDAVTRRRLDLREAAEVLDTSVDAVRKRVARGTLESEKADGKVYVWLDDGVPRSDADALMSEMRARIDDLKEQLEAERQAHAEARRIIAGLVERVPQLEAPSEPPESPEAATETADEHPPGGAQEGARRPWWRRLFGGS
jgi:hypothetical protein